MQSSAASLVRLWGSFTLIFVFAEVSTSLQQGDGAGMRQRCRRGAGCGEACLSRDTVSEPWAVAGAVRRVPAADGWSRDNSTASQRDIYLLPGAFVL